MSTSSAAGEEDLKEAGTKSRRAARDGRSVGSMPWSRRPRYARRRARSARRRSTWSLQSRSGQASLARFPSPRQSSSVSAKKVIPMLGRPRTFATSTAASKAGARRARSSDVTLSAKLPSRRLRQLRSKPLRGDDDRTRAHASGLGSIFRPRTDASGNGARPDPRELERRAGSRRRSCSSPLPVAPR